METRDALMNAYADLDKAVKALNACGVSVDYSLKKQEKEEYTVIITETCSTAVTVKAISADSAKDMVRQMLANGTLFISYDYSNIEIDVL